MTHGRLKEILEQCYGWCGRHHCYDCPILNSCAEYLKAKSFAAFAFDGLKELSYRQKKDEIGE